MNAIDLFFESPNPEELYEQFSKRFQSLKRAASGIGWGYGDNVNDLVSDLQNRMGEE
jgi:hypothetical protein